MKHIKDFKIFEQDENDTISGFKIGKTYTTYSGANPTDYILINPNNKKEDSLISWRINKDGDSYTILRNWQGKDSSYSTLTRYNPDKSKKRTQPQSQPKLKTRDKKVGYRYHKKGLGKIFNPKGKPSKGSITR